MLLLCLMLKKRLNTLHLRSLEPIKHHNLAAHFAYMYIHLQSMNLKHWKSKHQRLLKEKTQFMLFFLQLYFLKEALRYWDQMDLFMLFQVKYPGGIDVTPGMVLTPTRVKDKPDVRFNADPDSYYTLIMHGELFLQWSNRNACLEQRAPLPCRLCMSEAIDLGPHRFGDK